MMGFFLFLISIILSAIFFPIGFFYNWVALWTEFGFREWWKGLNKFFFRVAIAVDQMGNVVMNEFFNDIIIKKSGHRFGNEDETISSVLGKNKSMGTLTLIGKGLAWVLNKLDPGHVEKSIEPDEQSGRKKK